MTCLSFIASFFSGVIIDSLVGVIPLLSGFQIRLMVEVKAEYSFGKSFVISLPLSSERMTQSGVVMPNIALFRCSIFLTAVHPKEQSAASGLPLLPTTSLIEYTY